MQLLVPSFPIGAPGMGLVLLRFAVAASLLSESLGHPRPVLIAAAGIAFSVSLGFLTTMTALLAALMHAVGAFAAATDAALIFTSIAQPLALTLLGPGAYSLDARLFGRRLIFESRRHDDSN